MKWYKRITAAVLAFVVALMIVPVIPGQADEYYKEIEIYVDGEWKYVGNFVIDINGPTILVRAEVHAEDPICVDIPSHIYTEYYDEYLGEFVPGIIPIEYIGGSSPLLAPDPGDLMPMSSEEDTGIFADCENVAGVTVPVPVEYSDIEILEYAFSGNSDLKFVQFKGDGDDYYISSEAFSGVTATVYYPADNATWTEDIMQDYGGTLTWVPVATGEKPHVCTEGYCDKGYTDNGDGTHDYGCSVCGIVDIDNESHTDADSDHSCDLCGAYCEEIVDYPVTGGTLRFCKTCGLVFRFIPENDTDPISVEIPAVIDGKTVGSVGCNHEGWGYNFPSAFDRIENVVSVTLPDTLERIGMGAFANSGVKSMIVPESVTSIDLEAFADSALESIEIHGKLDNIIAVFAGCTSLKTIRFYGDAPDFISVFVDGRYGFQNVTATIYYPADNTTWQEKIDEFTQYDYGGTLTWVATDYSEEEPHVCSKAYTDNGDGTHDYGCSACGVVEIDNEAHSYDGDSDTDCNTCGAIREVSSEPEEELNVDRAIIRLQEQMKMGFYYEMATDETVLETGAIVWTGEEYAEETAFDINHTCGKKYSGQAENTDGTYYSIETDGIPAQAIDTELYILPYTKTANGYSYGETIKSNSILNVAKNQYNSEDTTDDVKAVIVDVLNYSTAARDYFVAKGEMEAPAEDFNAILSDSEKDLAWRDDLLTARADVQETWEEYSPATDKVYVNIQDSLKIQFVFADTSVEDGMYWQGDDYTNSTVHDITTATGKTEVSVQNGYVSCAISGINAYNIYDNFYVRAWGKEGKLTRTYTHSIAAYLTNQIKACEGKTDTESLALVDLCKAMLIYGKSAQESDAVNKG